VRGGRTGTPFSAPTDANRDGHTRDTVFPGAPQRLEVWLARPFARFLIRQHSRLTSHISL